MTKKRVGSYSLGTIRGVFIPTFLTIIGVILFLRLGYIVGSAGIVGTIAIILLAISVTFATAFSLSSIITTIKVGAGGAYSIISKTLGLEVGGSAGIPLYLAQALSVALYVFGFVEGWRFIFPAHPRLLVIAGVFVVLFVLTYISARLAINAQVVVFVILLISLVSVFAGGNWWGNIVNSPTISDFPFDSFWMLFALFFPAATGLMSGIGMSGELRDPKRQIPHGVLAALGITSVIYILMVFWYGYSASPEQLTGNNLIVVRLAAYGPLVLLGILASTFSSALTTLVAAPRVLQAMGENSVLPFSAFFAQKNEAGNPRNSTLFTCIILLICLLIGNLNAIAPVLTMFFLITYAMINMVVFIEQSIGLVSFRPTMKVPKIVPLYGGIVSIVFMFYTNTIAGLFALAFLFITYLVLVKRHLIQKQGDVRSGLFLAMSEWAAKKVMVLPESTEHTWKPSILLPVSSTNSLLGNFPLVKSIVYPNGTLSVLGMDVKKSLRGKRKLSSEQMEKQLQLMPELVKKFGKEGIFTNYAKIKALDYIDGTCIALQAVEGQFFHPNILFLPVHPQDMAATKLNKIFDVVKEARSGLIVFDKDPTIGLGSEEDVHIWISPNALEREDFYLDRTFDLAMLIAYRLYSNWAGKISLWMCVEKKQEDIAKSHLRKLVYEARFPASTEINVSTDSFLKTFRNAPRGDIHVFSVIDFKDMKVLLNKVKKVRRSCIYVMDSSQEDILA